MAKKTRTHEQIAADYERKAALMRVKHAPEVVHVRKAARALIEAHSLARATTTPDDVLVRRLAFAAGLLLDYYETRGVQLVKSPGVRYYIDQVKGAEMFDEIEDVDALLEQIEPDDNRRGSAEVTA